MPIVQTLDWSNASANGTFQIGNPGEETGVTIATTTNAGGQTASIAGVGSPATDALWVSGLTEPVTTSLAFASPTANVTFSLFDVDQGPGWDDMVTVIAYDANGTPIEVQFSNLTEEQTAAGSTVNASAGATGAADAASLEGALNVTIPGPVSRIEVIFDNGESSTGSGVIGISDIVFSPVPDGIVEGDDAANLIDFAYVDDAEGDQVTDGDTLVEAGGGNDTVWTGEGNDTILGGSGDDSINADAGNDSIDGGTGADSIYGGFGDDTIVGGTGDDTANGHYGNDILDGGLGNDSIRGSWGNDTLYSGSTGEGDDFIWGGWGDDQIIMETGFGNDTILGDTEDEVYGDTLDLTNVTSDLRLDLSSGFPGRGTVSDGTSTANFTDIEHIELSGATDTIVLANGSGDDRVIGFQLPVFNLDGTITAGDQLDVSAVTMPDGTPITADNITVTQDADSNAVLAFPAGDTLTLVGVTTADLASPAIWAQMGVPSGSDGIIRGTENADLINAGYIDDDGDIIDGNDAKLPGTTGDDDRIQGGDGNDTIYAGAGNDAVTGDVGDDVLYGGAGNDTLAAGAGNDTLDGGSGADALVGGADRDLFVNVGDGDEVIGGDDGDDYDTLDLTGAGPIAIHYDENNREDGRVDFLDAEGAVTGSMVFKGIEHIVPCFTPGTKIATVNGARAVETLEPGDQIFTRDHGVQEIRWIGHKTVTEDLLSEATFLAPIKIRKGALGDNLPDRDMLLSPNHRVLVTAPEMQPLFGQSEVLVAAKHLTRLKGISRAQPESVTYIHMMFDRHEIIWSDGIWSESFQPGSMAIAGLETAQRDEIFCLFPELATQKSTAYRAARRILRKHEAALLPQGQS